jgi:hypothetical protein
MESLNIMALSVKIFITPEKKGRAAARPQENDKFGIRVRVLFRYRRRRFVLGDNRFSQHLGQVEADHLKQVVVLRQ